MARRDTDDSAKKRLCMPENQLTMKRFHLLLILLTVTAFSLWRPGASHAQDRSGFWAGLGAGYGSMSATCDGCPAGSREGSLTACVRAGWTLSDRVLLGGEINIWTREQRDRALNATRVANLYNFSGTATVYPLIASGFFVKAGAGAAFVDDEIRGSSSAVRFERGKGPGLLAGVGYDIRIARSVSVTPAFNFWYGRPGKLRIIEGAIVRGFRYHVFEFTVGLTFH
jgi:hypothetical protein